MTKKLFKILSSALMCATPLTSLINYSHQNSHNIEYKKYIVLQNEVTESKYFTFNAVKSGDDDSIVSLSQLNDHIAAIEDKAQYELYAAGYTEEVVYPIIGQLKANINQEIENQKEARGLSANAELDEDGIRSVYGYINNQASIFGVDVADFDKFAATIPTLAAHYENDLLSHKYSQEDASKEANNFRNDLVSILNRATENLYDTVHLTLAMYPKTNSLSQDKQDSYRQARLSAVLTWIKSNANSLISMRPDGLSLLADYSDDNIGLIQPGVELATQSYDYMSNFFNYKYSVVEGWNVHQISLDDIPATTASDEYDQEILKGTHITAPLDSLRGNYSTFNKDEVLPGYKLHAKIKNISNMTNSHSCNIEFSFGISERDDDYVLWDDFLNSNSSDENSKIKFTVTFNDFSLINNISKNVYWKDFSLTANLPTKDAPDSNGVYYSDTANIRTNIDKIMAAYKGDNTSIYDLKTNPIILNDEARKGISLPTNFNANLLNNFYTNQEFALIASDVNTVDNTLCINWAIIDKNIGENNQTKNDFYVVKNIPWNINDSLVDTIKVQFNVSEELQNMMYCSNSNESIYNSLANIAALKSIASNDNLKKVKNGLIYDSSFIGVQTVCALAISILTGIYICKIAATFGGDLDSDEAVAVGIGTVAVILGSVGFMIANNVKAWSAYKDAKKTASKISLTGVYSKQINDSYKKISDDYAIVNNLDPQVSYAAKQKAAIDANNVAYKTNLLMKGHAIEQWIDRDEFKKAGFSDDKINEMINSLYEEPSYSSNGDSKDMLTAQILTLFAASINVAFLQLYEIFTLETLFSVSSSLMEASREVVKLANFHEAVQQDYTVLTNDLELDLTPEGEQYVMRTITYHCDEFYKLENQNLELCTQYDKAERETALLKSGLKWFPFVIGVISVVDLIISVLDEILKPYIIK